MAEIKEPAARKWAYKSTLNVRLGYILHFWGAMLNMQYKAFSRKKVPHQLPAFVTKNYFKCLPIRLHFPERYLLDSRKIMDSTIFAYFVNLMFAQPTTNQPAIICGKNGLRS